MTTYFHGWRRKIGVLTLVMACVFAAGWVRGLSIPPNSYEGIRLNFEFTSAGVEFELEDFAHTLQSPWSSSSHLNLLATLFIPYWSVVIPLTLLSAYLLLSKGIRRV